MKKYKARGIYSAKNWKPCTKTLKTINLHYPAVNTIGTDNINARWKLLPK